MGGAFAILFMAYGAQYSFGVFLSAMLDELGWSRTGLSGAFSLYAFVYTALALVAGRLTDRWGPRAVIAVGGAFLGAGWVAMGGVREPWHPYVFYGIVAAVGMSAAFVPCSATVARWFVRRRGSPSASHSAAWGWARSCSPRWRTSSPPAWDGAGPTSSSVWPSSSC